MAEEKFLSDFPPVSKEEWKKQIIQDLNGGDYDKKMLWNTIDNLTFEPFYMLEDIENLPFIHTLPSQSPFLRGYNNKKNQWLITQSIDCTDIEKANRIAIEGLKKGVEALEFRLKFTYLSELSEIEKLLQGIDITKTHIHFVGSHSYSILLELLKQYCNLHKIDTKQVKGSFNFDSFAFYLLNGYYYNSCEDNINELKFLYESALKHFPSLHILTINGQHFHNAGGSTIQEIVYTLSSAHEYLVLLLEKGLKIEDILPRMRIAISVGSSYFIEIAKIRALRTLWATIVKKYTNNEELQKITIHAQSSLWNKTIFDSYNNILRSTTEAMSAILGGCDYLTLYGFDITYREPDEFSQRIASNIQMILRHEAFFDKILDPAGGSYYIEKLTNTLIEKSWEQFIEIEEKGGYRKVLESGEVVNNIEAIAQKRIDNITSRKTTIVGVNQYPNLNETKVNEFEKTYVIQPKGQVLKLKRGAELFEELRLATENYVAQGGIKPKVYLAPYGNLAMRLARAQFATNFFGIAGFEIIEGEPIKAIEWTVHDIMKHKADFVVICSSDPEYAEVAPELTKAIKSESNDVFVIIAGNPTDLIDMLKESGVDDFIHIRTNPYNTLKCYQNRLGIKLI